MKVIIKLVSVCASTVVLLALTSAGIAKAQIAPSVALVAPVGKNAQGYVVLGHRIANNSPAISVLASASPQDLVLLQGRLQNGKVYAATASLAGSFIPGSTTVYVKSVVTRVDAATGRIRVGSLWIDVSQILNTDNFANLAVGTSFEAVGVLYSPTQMAASAIIGGDKAIIGGDSSAIIGGDKAIIGGDSSAIIGGDKAIIGGDSSAIIGGDKAIIGGDSSAIIGGDKAIIGGDSSAIIGGDKAIIGGDSSAIIGGDKAIIGGDSSAIIGGDKAIIGGDSGATIG